MIGDSSAFGRCSAILMVGNNGYDLGVQPANADLIQKMQHGVVEFGNHEHDPGFSAGIGHREFHGKPFACRFQRMRDGLV